MKNILIPIILISLILAVGVGYYFINNAKDASTSLQYEMSTDTDSMTATVSPTQADDARGPLSPSTVVPTVVTEVNIDDLDAAIDSLDLSDLNDSMSDLQTQ